MERFAISPSTPDSTATADRLADMPRMTRTGTSWRDWDSAIAGPKARVTVHGGRDFKNRKAGLEPNQRLANTNAEGFGAFADINSLQVHCSTR
jgi:hypothetical protein